MAPSFAKITEHGGSEMLSALQLYKLCIKMYFFEGETKQCATCNERGKVNRAKVKKRGFVQIRRLKIQTIYREYLILCPPTLFVDKYTAEGVQSCAKYLKGCRTKLGSDYTNKSCQDC